MSERELEEYQRMLKQYQEQVDSHSLKTTYSTPQFQQVRVKGITPESPDQTSDPSPSTDPRKNKP